MSNTKAFSALLREALRVRKADEQAARMVELRQTIAAIESEEAEH